MSKSAAFSLSATEYERLKAAAKYHNKTISMFIKDIVWPHVVEAEYDITNADRITAEIQADFKAGGYTPEDLATRYNKPRDEIAAILRA